MKHFFSFSVWRIRKKFYLCRLETKSFVNGSFYINLPHEDESKLKNNGKKSN